jgi:hypothetical protein
MCTHLHITAGELRSGNCCNLILRNFTKLGEHVTILGRNQTKIIDALLEDAYYCYVPILHNLVCFEKGRL